MSIPCDDDLIAEHINMCQIPRLSDLCRTIRPQSRDRDVLFPCGERIREMASVDTPGRFDIDAWHVHTGLITLSPDDSYRVDDWQVTWGLRERDDEQQTRTAMFWLIGASTEDMIEQAHAHLFESPRSASEPLEDIDEGLQCCGHTYPTFASFMAHRREHPLA